MGHVLGAMFMAGALFLLPASNGLAEDVQPGLQKQRQTDQTTPQQREIACECCKKCRAATKDVKDREEKTPGTNGCRDCCSKCGTTDMPGQRNTPPEIVK